MSSEDVYIAGIDMIKFGKFPDRSVESLGAEAALGALDDAGVNINDIQALYAGNLMQASAMVGQRIQQQIGQTGIPAINCSNACATGATAFREGWIAIKAGIYDTVLAVGVEKLAGAGMLGGGGGGQKGIHPEGILGSGSMPCVFAEAGMSHARMYGTTFEQFAQIAMKNHHHSTMNPKARYQIETPLEEVMGAEMISYPNTKLMCSANVDGSAAAVLMSEKKVKESSKAPIFLQPPEFLLAVGKGGLLFVDPDAVVVVDEIAVLPRQAYGWTEAESSVRREEPVEGVGLDPLIGNVQNPLPWLAEMMDIKKEQNFFEGRVTEYQKASSLDIESDDDL